MILLFSLVAYGQTAKEYLKKGTEYTKTGEYQSAIDDLTECLRIDTNYALAYNMRGFAYRNLGNYEEAIADYTRAIRIDPDRIDDDIADAKYWRGEAYYNLGNYEKAIADFTEFIRLAPDIADTYYNRGLAKLKLGQKESGCLDLSKARELGFADANDEITKYCQK